jgi:hypothetical protein
MVARALSEPSEKRKISSYKGSNDIHLSPIRAGLPEKTCHYIYSSANNYFTGKGFWNQNPQNI